MSAKKLLKPIKSMLHNLVGEDVGDEIFAANFPPVSKEEKKKLKDKERVLQILDCLKDTPNKITDKMIKDFKKITGTKIYKTKKKNVRCRKRKI